jgi:sec-independent protein translocase protein TatA
MGSLSIWHWLIVGIVVMLLFGKGRFSDLMGDVAKGIKSFKKGMAEEDEPQRPPARLQSQANPDPNPSHDLQPMKDDRPQG